MQELNGNVTGLLRDLLEFLECLGDIELPEALRSSRETLATKARMILERQNLESPEPYLDMNAGNKCLLLSTDEIDQPEEYIVADEKSEGQRGSLQHYYETFQDFQGDGKKKEDSKTDKNNKIDDMILMYASFSAIQAKARSAKSGPLLHLKRERKMFTPFNVFWLNRQCWVSLVGTHLLLFANERESRPYLVIPLEGYKSRAAPNALTRDPRRSEAAFEVYCPGDKTFQFVAKNVQEMREWVDIITESLEPPGIERTKRAQTFVEILELESNERMCIEKVKEEKEKYQDVLNSPKSKTKEKVTPVKSNPTTPEKEKPDELKEDAPPLPARSRRLPSLPSQERISYEPREELYDEEGLYHRIEDIKAQREYQNFQFVSKEKQESSMADFVVETYDDVEVFVDRSKEKNDEITGETYDDVHNVVQSRDESISYDDVQTVAENLQSKVEKDKSTKSVKSSIKRSFLDRVRINRKESMRKDDKSKSKSPTPTPTPISTPKTSTTVEPELPCYDDIAARGGVQEEEYLCPPPPRPIYSRPPTIIKCAVPDEIYDDIGNGLELNGNGCKGCANVDVIRDYPKNGSFLSDLQLSIDHEHYQVPKSNNRVVEHQEELYDDVALSETFKNRPREYLPTSPDKSVWSRFGSGKKPKIFENVIGRQNSCNDSNETTDDDQQQQLKVKQSFQKLISKVENTLGKATKTNGVTQS